ncbi:MAG: substrate-binding domain-containing protein [Chitinispirillaceae bacterium]
MRTLVIISAFFVMFASHQINAQIVTGKILDSQSDPIPDVTITLQNTMKSTVTDQNGNFRIERTSAVMPTSKGISGLEVKNMGNTFHITTSSGTEPKIRLIDTKGRQIHFNRSNVSPNCIAVSLGKSNRKAAGLLFMEIEYGTKNRKTVFPVMNGFKFPDRMIDMRNKSNNVTIAALSSECSDTLVCTKSGLLTKRVPINTCDNSETTLYMYSEDIHVTSDNYPVIDGSTSTQPVGIVLASTLLGTSYGYQGQLDGSKQMAAHSTSNPALADSINNHIVSHNKTHGAHMNVIDGTAKLGMVARMPSEDELTHADSLGVELEITPFALDAFTFLVHSKNPVKNISLEDIRSIYTGSITNWNELGGHDLNIRPYQRNRNSGSQEMMMSMVMGDLEMIDSPNMIMQGMMGPYNALEHDTAGIGYTVYFYGLNMSPDFLIDFCSVDDVFPDYETIQNRQYPLWSDVYLINRTDLDRTSLAAHIRDFILAPQGQQVVKTTGYVPVDETGIEQDQ